MGEDSGGGGGESRRIAMVGIPGVGKTTLVARLVDELTRGGRTARVVSFGTMMLEEARKKGLSDRDLLRKLPIDEQRGLQRTAAERIALFDEEFVIVDTHAFIVTPSGYYPGLPVYVLEALRPATIVSVYASPEDIYTRRLKDATRSRDKVSIGGIKTELTFHQSMISACSVVSGAPVKAVLNPEGGIWQASSAVMEAVGVGKNARR